MNIKILFGTVMTLAFTTAYAQTPDNAKLDQFLDRLAERIRQWGSFVIVKDDEGLYTRAIGYIQISKIVGP